MPQSLPFGWTRTTLGEITKPTRSRALPSDVPTLKYVGLEHIESQTMRLLGTSFASEVRSSSTRFSKGDVLYGKMRPYLNKVWVADFAGICSTEFLVFPAHTGIDSQFLALRLNAEDFVSFANGKVSGERPRVDFASLSPFPILLPPSAEQARIVAKVNGVFERTRKGEQATQKARDQLDSYRMAVLHDAVTGALTERWRQTRSNGETGAEQLERIIEARRGGHTDRRRTGDSDPVRPVTTGLSRLPASWTWATLDQLTMLVTSGSRGWKSFYSERGAIFIRSQDIREDKLNLSQVAHVKPPKSTEGKRTRVKRNDLLVTITGANVGRAAIVDSELSEAYVSQHVALIRLVDARVVEFIHAYLTAGEDGRRHLLAEAYGAGKPGLNLPSIRKLPVPLPPSAEQAEIIRLLRLRLSAADRLAIRLEEQIRRAREIRQSILRKAFSGSLVSQHANDTSASVLLEEILREREADATQPKGKRMSKSRSKPIARPLLDVLGKQAKGLTPEMLFQMSGFAALFNESDEPQDVVDAFYKELRSLTAPPAQVEEERTAKGQVTLKVKP